jgi:hypothetical protein
MKGLADAARRIDAEDKEESRRAVATGLSAAVRAALPEIERLRHDRIKWISIAAAFSAHGYRQGKDQKPITASRLTAIYHQVLAQEKRSTLPNIPPPDLASSRPCAASAELSAKNATPVDAPEARDLEELIRLARSKEIEQLTTAEITR